MPILLDLGMTLWPHAGTIMMAKPAFQWLEACPVQFATPILEECAAFISVKIQREPGFATLKRRREYTKGMIRG
jgi:hypothetical protein